MTNEEKAVGLSLQVRDLCIEKGVTKDNAETASLLVQQAALQMAQWKDEQAKRQFIDKAVRWLKDDALHYCYKSAFTGDAMIDINRLAERFEIAMQED